MRSKLDTAANVAILILCVVSIVALGRSFWPADSGPREVEPGEVVGGLRPHLPVGAERTLMVALSPDCGYCTRSLPFYKRLAEDLGGAAATPLLAVVHDPQDLPREQALMDHFEVSFDKLLSLDFATAGLTLTPTLLLVDSEARVLKLWHGQLKPDQEAEVLRAVRGQPVATAALAPVSGLAADPLVAGRRP